LRQEKLAFRTLRLYFLLLAWLKQEEAASQRPIIVREWHID
jgi:hypothetical protein